MSPATGVVAVSLMRARIKHRRMLPAGTPAASSLSLTRTNEFRGTPPHFRFHASQVTRRISSKLRSNRKPKRRSLVATAYASSIDAIRPASLVGLDRAASRSRAASTGLPVLAIGSLRLREPQCARISGYQRAQGDASEGILRTPGTPATQAGLPLAASVYGTKRHGRIGRFCGR